MKRRRLLALGAAGATGTILLSLRAHRKRASVAAPSLEEVQQRLQQLPTPNSAPVHRSINGLLELDLAAGYQVVDLQGSGSSGVVATYNGQLPGPRLEVKPGDRLRIRLTNNLLTPTNLHYHGLHVSPLERGDNVFISVEPGESFLYEFTIPLDHPAGTFWYHPHRHGFVADQVAAGLSGFLIVRGDLDEIPEVAAASEVFWAMKDFQFDDAGNLAQPEGMAAMMGREGDLITLAGQLSPNLPIPANGLLRLRLLNASVSRFYRLQLQQHSMHLIATDGGALSAPVELEELLLVPGERAEVLIRGDRTPGQYSLVNLPYDRGGMAMMGGMGDNPENQSQSESPGMMAGMKMEDMNMEGHSMGQTIAGTSANPESMALATLTYKDSLAEPLPLPVQLIPIVPLGEAQNLRRIELSMRMSLLQGMAFTLNDKTFDHNRVDITVPLNRIEEWEIANVDSDKMDHPFHLHVNSFQVVSRDGKPEPYLAWKDTVLVKGGETVKLRVQFLDFPGKTVYHCHILDHEEQGMMGIIEMKA